MVYVTLKHFRIAVPVSFLDKKGIVTLYFPPETRIISADPILYNLSVIVLGLLKFEN